MAPSSYYMPYTGRVDDSDSGSFDIISEKTPTHSDVTASFLKEWSFRDAWDDFWNWIVHFFRGINDESEFSFFPHSSCHTCSGTYGSN